MKRCEHLERPSVARCMSCGKILCYECRVSRKGRNFCADCAPGKPSGFRSPSFSMFLSLFPGLGQIYAGSSVRGLFFMIGTVLLLCMQTTAVLPLCLWVLSIWDARMTAMKRNHGLTKGRSGPAGASEGDWMLLLGSVGLVLLYIGLPRAAGIVMEPWALWTAFFVVLGLSMLLGRGGKDADQPIQKA